MFLVVFTLSVITPKIARAAIADPSEICDKVSEIASARTGVPVSVLKAISLTETGRKRAGAFRPWPWTINMEGKGVWFDNNEEARAYVDENYARGARSFDVGCFQINYKWHHQNFDSLDAMFDPLENGLYAARYLSELYAESGDWETAAGAYHSRNPEYANRYKARFAGFRNRFIDQDGIPLRVAAADLADSAVPHIAAPVAHIRVNNFPLLQGGGETATGSLMPLSAKGASGSLFSNTGKGLFSNRGQSLFAPDGTG
ncbi:MAG: transglycosylase SLT domain-containing protein [Maritimibacter sp.]